MELPSKYRYTESYGTEETEAILRNKTRRLTKKDAFPVTASLRKQIETINKAVIETGVPPDLVLARVNTLVATGVFLHPKAKPIKAGTLIGIYTGIYELVPSDLSSHNAYAYDLMQGIRLKKTDLSKITRFEKKPTTEEEYSIQTNALEAGNFTRFINHGSLAPNIEAVIGKVSKDRLEVLLFALEDIQPGEQLISSYGGAYWKALGIIPDDITPRTYRLQPDGKVACFEKFTRPDPETERVLLGLRNTELSSESVSSRSVYKKFCKTIPSLSKKAGARIEKLIDVMTERAVPRDICLQGSAYKALVPIPKNTCLGVFAGTLSCEPEGLLLGKTTRSKLYLHSKGNTTYLGRLPTSPEGNLILKPLYDPEQESLILAAFTYRPLLPGETLSLRPFSPKNLQ